MFMVNFTVKSILKSIIFIYFKIKNILKNNHYHILKYPLLNLALFSSVMKSKSNSFKI